VTIDPKQERARRQRAGLRDMALTLVVIMVPVIVVYYLFSHTPEPTAQAVDWKPAYTQAQAEASYPVLAPAGLPDTWVPTHARFTAKGESLVNGATALGNTWQLGYVSPEMVYVGLTQRDVDGDRLVRELLKDPLAEGASTIAGQPWQRYASADGGTRALVRTANDVTTIVVSAMSYEGLEAFAATLA